MKRSSAGRGGAPSGDRTLCFLWDDPSVATRGVCLVWWIEEQPVVGVMFWR